MTYTTIARRAARFCILVTIVIVTWEACTRIQDYVQLGVPPLSAKYVKPPIYAYDAAGPHGIPHAVDGIYRMNGLGFRGPELVPGRETILCLGASETFGIGATDGNEYPRQLERDLNAGPAPRYQVVNAALPGERIEDIAGALPRILQAVRPGYALLYVGPASVVWTRERWNKLHPTPAAKDPPPVVYGRFRLLYRLKAIVDDNVPEPIAGFERKKRIAEAVAAAQAVPTSHLPEQNFLLFRGELERTLDILAAARVRTILVTHATRFGPDLTFRDKELDDVLAYYPAVSPAGLADTERRLNALLRHVARERNLPIVDAADLIAPGAENFADFFHFTDRGGARMASLLTDAVRSSESEPARRGRGDGSRNVAVARTPH
jgi:lysophospholipase L1-like esterase